MNILENVYRELAELGLDQRGETGLQEIRNKDGIYLYRVEYQGQFYVLKYFLNEAFRREIANYRILRQLEVPTIRVLGQTECSLLLEDLERSQEYRLGVATDLTEVEVARALAKWYTQLHNHSSDYLNQAESTDHFYREIDLITRENLELVREKSGTQGESVWELIFAKLDWVLEKVRGLDEVLTYNDFYWTNLAVSRDQSQAMMFDYNLLGVGLRYSDLRNVCSSLSAEAGQVFVQEYGGINEDEKLIDAGLSILINLISAYQRPEFPKWGEESLEDLRSGELERAFTKVVELFS